MLSSEQLGNKLPYAIACNNCTNISLFVTRGKSELMNVTNIPNSTDDTEYVRVRDCL